MQRLEQITFRDRARSVREIGELSRALPLATRNRLDLLLASSPAAEDGLRYFVRLHERHPGAFQRLTRSTAGLRYLIAVFAYSAFLSEEILEHPEWVEELLENGQLHQALTSDELRGVLEAENASDPHGGPLSPLPLARFRRRQMLRILVRDILGLGTLPEITRELTALADAIVEVAYARIREQLIAEFGIPLEDSEDRREARFSILALGKMGGEELNYSSDIDLMFLYSANGETEGPARITNKEFFKYAANRLTSLLSTYTSEGMCYRVDLRLRPDGSLGEVCIPLDGARQYYEHRARDWELQMMIKARVAAGDVRTGRALLDFVEPRTYATTLDFSAVEALSATRERLNEKLTARQRARRKPREVPAAAPPLDVKLAPGGIRDIEFLVQCLQRLYGGAEPWLRHGGTMLALARLNDKDFLSDAEFGTLASAYQFLRHLEHRLQFDDDRQTHTLPVAEDALELLGRRMPGGGGSAEWLLAQTLEHLTRVRVIYERVIRSRALFAEVPAGAAGQPSRNVMIELEQRAPALMAALFQASLHRSHKSFEHFLERLSDDAARLERLNSNPVFAAHTLDLFEHSPYFAEEMIRSPELVDEIARATGAAAHTASPPTMAELRRWYRREMLRIQAASVCLAEPIFDTLERTSGLADAVIARAYEIAITEVRVAHPPAHPSYRPAGQMWVIALGRLGMHEFDMASDADLVFVLADTDARELEFWTRVAERFVDLVTAYTGEGVLFAVDTRLRPNGTAGPLVNTEAAFKEYFERTAEAWEGITYMKSRAVAGDPDRAEFFLHELQELDWKRYGQGGRSRTDLKQMRAKIDGELGAAHPLKAGRGGYYDIDFILMYLRLKGAGIFYKVLNTPERISVLETMGQLDQGDAEFLNDVATFYRALDHGIRVLTGHAQDRLPVAESQMEALSVLLKRWAPFPLDAVEGIRSQTRAMFDRIFG